MYVRWDPENGEPVREWEFDPEDLLKSEAKRIEKQYNGKSIEVWLQGLKMKEVSAREVLLWHLLRADHRNLAFADVPDFRMRQMKIEMSSAELRALQNRLEKMKFTDDERDQLRSAFEIDFADAMRRETGVHEGEVVDTSGELVPKAS